MTRINIDLSVEELCDQHLIAEYRELPRMVGFAEYHRWLGMIIPDVPFTLNKGHMKSCVRYGTYLAERHHHIVQEMKYRGFKPNFPPIELSHFPIDCRNYPSQAWLDAASDIVRVRIVDRLSNMKREPTWTNRYVPHSSIPKETK